MVSSFSQLIPVKIKKILGKSQSQFRGKVKKIKALATKWLCYKRDVHFVWERVSTAKSSHIHHAVVCHSGVYPVFTLLTESGAQIMSNVKNLARHYSKHEFYKNKDWKGRNRKEQEYHAHSVCRLETCRSNK